MLKKSDDQTNIDRFAANIKKYHIKILLLKNHHSKIHDEKRQIFHVKIYVKMLKINMLKMQVRTFWSQLWCCYTF